jgi:hypothetical protein
MLEEEPLEIKVEAVKEDSTRLSNENFHKERSLSLLLKCEHHVPR